MTEALRPEVIRHALCLDQSKPRLQSIVQRDVAQDQIKAIARMRSRTQLARVATRAQHLDVGDSNRSGVGPTGGISHAEPLGGHRVSIFEARISHIRLRYAIVTRELLGHPPRVGLAFAHFEIQVLPCPGRLEAQEFLDPKVLRACPNGRRHRRFWMGMGRLEARLDV